ncbi:TaqI-like C-terminal specificity domain-containing protein [Meiothermus sp. CFH 77666]|uniref:Eco57I restriction-modification methylase domain-containing protein n=1 Tax=Meiothermus sp. CFH 77666 TaxID=2817942 RepID=UPI001AA06150|nr:TaqI-like C-terminal specificity domain-containing protein [Meiothermus sp. CFH 77666]MBO1437512.1 Eco57I restriction-modification methylase domain-containing protein [Meiothermus sp. CFH 77666]
MSQELREHLTIALQDFAKQPLEPAARSLWRVLGYQSSRTAPLHSLDDLPDSERLAELKAHTRQFRFLFQLTTDEIRLTHQPSLGLEGGRYENQIIESYVFVALELNEPQYTRGNLAEFTRRLNRAFPMPVMVLFKYGEFLTLAAVERRVNKRDEGKDVIERNKVTLIKDIRFQQPHRAHLDILVGLALPSLSASKAITHFVELDRAWRKQLDTQELNKRFYQELANWFYWASEHPEVSFPDVAKESQPVEKRRKLQMQLIRLITRLIFVWFLREKGLVPNDLFEPSKLQHLLKAFKKDDPQDSTYYQAILQNLFFATLNQPMRRDDPQKPKARRFVEDGGFLENRNEYGVNGFRYKSAFANPDAALELFDTIPFMNGGLFECLDVYADKQLGIEERRIDGFSREPKNRARVPNELFFAQEQLADLNSYYGTRGKRYRVRGLIELLERYKFTVTENTPIEEEVALDPELLGKVFENLLAAYNPETEETARRETGSFYTPRDVVDFMVDESLLVYLHEKLSSGQPAQVAGSGAQAPILYPPEGLISPQGNPSQDDHLKARLRRLLDYQSEPPPFSEEEKRRIIEAIDECKIIDPACGSGAFPLGALQKLVHILEQLDPHGQLWREQQEANLRREIERDPVVQALKLDLTTIQQINLEAARNQAQRAILEELNTRIRTLQEAFDPYLTYPDYARKLYLIENCIYGVDIQPIAVQIAKLRCFIALIVDQKHNDQRENRGILPLPNLETKFVAANSLFPLEQPGMWPTEVYKKEAELKHIRHQHFLARSYAKKKALRQRDAQIRAEIAQILEHSGFASDEARRMAQFDPYNQNDYARFFDPHWMFSLECGFDIVIGNPPYIRQEKITADKPIYEKVYSDVFTGTADLYVYFFRLGLKLLRQGGVLCYICSNKYFRSAYGARLRHYLSRHTRIQLLIDFGDAPVFTAITSPSIILTQNAQPNGNVMRVLSWNPQDNIADFRPTFQEKHFPMPQSSLADDGWRIERPETLALLEKLRKAGTPLGEYVGGRFYRGILTGLNEAFVVDRATRDRLIAEHKSSAEVLKPFLRGRDVKRWRIQNPDLWLIFTRRGIDIDKYPAIKKHLSKYKDRLTPGIPGGRKPGSYKWYEIQDNIAYWKEFEQPKILWQELAVYQAFAWDESGIYSNNKTFFIPDAKKWMLALFNSKVMYFLFTQLVQQKENGGFFMQGIYLEKLPIPKPTPQAEALVTRLVDYILLAARAELREVVAALEQVVDALVFELYLPEELHRAGRFPLKVLSEVRWPDKPSLQELRALVQQLWQPEHPVRKLVCSLESIPEVRLIQQSAAKNNTARPTPEDPDAEE